MEEEVLAGRVRARYSELSPAEQQFASFLLQCSPDQVVFGTASSLGLAAGTSDATVVRTVKRLGYAGLAELKREMGTAMARSVPPGVRLAQRIEQIGGDLGAVVDQVFDEATERLDATRAALDPQALRSFVDTISAAHEVVTFGAGASELAARHLALKLNRVGRRARYLVGTGFNLADEILSLGPQDCVLVCAPLRLLHEVEVLLDDAGRLGARRLLIADAPLQARLAGRVEASLHAPHTPTGATAEGLPAVLLADVIVLAVAAADETVSVAASERLTRLREEIVVGLDRRDKPSRS